MQHLKFIRPALLLSAGLALAGCGDSSKSSTSGGNVITAPVDYLGAVAKGKTSSENKLSLVNIQQAIQGYEAQEGKHPKDLQDLVKAGLLPAIPKAPNGMKFSYDPSTATVKVVPE